MPDFGGHTPFRGFVQLINKYCAKWIDYALKEMIKNRNPVIIKYKNATIRPLWKIAPDINICQL